MTTDDIAVNVKSMYGAKGQKPLVTLQWGDRTPFQMPPSKAREIAMLLLEAAESAEQDGFIVHFFQRVARMSEDRAVQVLLDFREYRDSVRSIQ